MVTFTVNSFLIIASMMRPRLTWIVLWAAALSLAGACKKDGDAALPEFKPGGDLIKVAEDVQGSKAEFNVYLSEAPESSVTVDYTTMDSTAVAGIHYVGQPSGSVTFDAGQKSKVVSIPVLHDTASKEDVVFKVVFSNPTGAVLGKETLKVQILNVDYANLVWSDEFNEGPLNTSWWNYEQGNNNGWGNNELEVYTNKTENVHIDSGYLHISALSPVPGSFTSGRITTLGKQEYTYGRIELRAMLPEGQGIWPALWMLGSNIGTVSWPKCGEIDIMELLGHQPEKVYGTAHWDENGHKYIGLNTSLTGTTFSEGFHEFTLIWTPSRLTWMVDKETYYSLSRTQISNFPFDLPMFLIFNVAVGGNWPGAPDETTVFPQHMRVDYVRWYR